MDRSNSEHPRAMIDVLRAVKADPMACHSIAVWEQVDAALADQSPAQTAAAIDRLRSTIFQVTGVRFSPQTTAALLDALKADIAPSPAADLAAAMPLIEEWEWPLLIGKDLTELRRRTFKLIQDCAAQEYIDQLAIAMLHLQGYAVVPLVRRVTETDLGAAWRAGRDAAAKACDGGRQVIAELPRDDWATGAMEALEMASEIIRALQPPAASKP